MSRLIDRNGPRDDPWVRIGDDVTAAAIAVPDAPLLLTLAQWRTHRDQLNDASTQKHAELGVLLGPADDPADLADDLARLQLVAVEFPNFTDGRGYSIARLLRQRYGYRGELRAVGDVLRDQLFFYARCGFDTFALRDDQDVAEAVSAFADFSEVYQAGVDRAPLFARRDARPEAA